MTTTASRFCRWCGNTKSDHAARRGAGVGCWMGFQPQPRPTCRVCGKDFDPAKSGRDDCCYRHRLDS
jgi:hypothetical protein